MYVPCFREFKMFALNVMSGKVENEQTVND